MNKIKTTQIKRELSRVFDIEIPILTDKEFYKPSHDDVINFIDNKYVIPEFKNLIFECEEFALNFMIEQRKSDNSCNGLNMAIGAVFGLKFKGVDLKHWCNIAFTSDDGILLIEPQNGFIWKPEKRNDDVRIIII